FGNSITHSLYDELPDAKEYITPSATLTADERMRLYNYSYWLRLFDILEEEYPFLSRLFGEQAFRDTIAEPFLKAFPPSHWSLNLLGRDLVTFLDNTYHEPDRWLILQAAVIDKAHNQSFFAVTKPTIDLSTYNEEAAEKLLDSPIELQTDVHLITSPGHIMNYREAFLKEPHEYWLENDFPILAKDRPYHFIIFRNIHLQAAWDELEPVEYELLRLIEKGFTIDQALDSVEVGDEAAFWVQKWLIRGWIIPKLTQ
ncbi:MAG: putative DNA-binding domain-containing protein, partial [Chlamydiales bacterium]|nr:putative DNA-binding domain-containing protein [Chlamydiales bacterium]